MVWTHKTNRGVWNTRPWVSRYASRHWKHTQPFGGGGGVDTVKLNEDVGIFHTKHSPGCWGYMVCGRSAAQCRNTCNTTAEQDYGNLSCSQLPLLSAAVREKRLADVPRPSKVLPLPMIQVWGNITKEGKYTQVARTLHSLTRIFAVIHTAVSWPPTRHHYAPVRRWHWRMWDVSAIDIFYMNSFKHRTGHDLRISSRSSPAFELCCPGYVWYICNLRSMIETTQIIWRQHEINHASQ